MTKKKRYEVRVQKKNGVFAFVVARRARLADANRIADELRTTFGKRNVHVNEVFS